MFLFVTPSLALAACDWFAYDDNSAPPVTGPEGGYDTTVPRDATGGPDVSPPEGGEGGGDAREEGVLEGGAEAESDADASVVVEAGGGCSACPCGCFDGSCTSALQTLGPASATASGQAVTLVQTSPNGPSTGGGPVAHADTVTVTTQTAPGGSTLSVGLAWATDPTVPPGSATITMTISSSTSAADTWTGTIPAQSGTTTEVYFYTFAAAFNNCKPTIYDPSNFVHYAYATN